ncbi:MAG TPA: aminotransferase class I/II-fold pyridoxal phosphate-dependent enzyme [Myxococcota bacterium]|nr:aminotransferase class I/II-fold pyridoxal phosphate-dependent enzyme [Myxococcota bacterium]
MPRFLRLAERLAELDKRGQRRQLRPLFPTSPTTAELDGEEIVVFSSNDYLGLARVLRSRWRGCGTGSSRLIAGDRNAHHLLEERLEALWCNPALVFPSGYQANLAVMTTLFEAGDLVASDALNHASLIDGLRLAPCVREIVEHPTRELPELLRGVVVEGLYSMDGDQLDLSRYLGEHWLVVDEAHAVGCLGPHGMGASYEQNVVPDVLIGTFGKAYGAAGAFVIGPPELKELLMSSGRSFVYTTGLAEPAARAALAGLEAATDERREMLAENVRRFRSGLHHLGRVPPGKDHIVAVVLGDQAMEVSGRMLAEGYFVPGIRHPTVAKGQERLRFSLSAAHTPEQIDGCLEALSKCLP